MKFLKRLALAALLIIVVIGAGGLLLGQFINPNDYRQEIENAALKQGGVELKINGEMDWSLFPWLGIAVNDIAVRFPDQPQLATLRQAQLSVRVMPLFSGQVVMDSVLIDGLKLNLITTGNANNWTSPSKPGSDSATKASDDNSNANSGSASAETTPSDKALNLDIQSFTLSNAQITYVDEPAGKQIEISALNLSSGQINGSQPVPITLDAQIKQLHQGQESLSGSLNLSTELTPDLAAQRYQLAALATKLTLNAAALGPQPLSLTLNTDLLLDLKQQQANLKQLVINLANLKAEADLQVSNFTKPQLRGTLAVDSFDLKQLLKQLGQAELSTADDQALRKLALKATLAGPANTLTLSPLTLQLDDTELSGKLSLDLATLAQTLELKGASLNADRYLPPQSTASQSGNGAPKAAKQGAERWSKEEIIPLAPLQSLNLDAKLDLDQLTLSGINANKVGLTLSAHGGLVKASRIDASLYSGTLRNSLTLDARKQPLQLAITNNVKGVQLGELLTELNGDAPITGSFNTQAMLKASGQSLHSIINSLNGLVDVSAADGVINGIDMAQTLCQGINNIASLGINAQQVDTATPFANLGGKFQIAKGIVSNDDLSATLDAMKLTGKGKVDLPQALIDYRLGLTVDENLFNKTCSVNNRLQGVEFPVNCKGSFDTAPAQMCRPDTSVITNLLKAEAKKKVEEKVTKKIEEKLGDKLGGEGSQKLLKGLFGN